jgi:hypothetical protein
VKSHITVILDSDVQSIEAKLIAELEKYRLHEDQEESVQSHHWDYWLYFYDEDKGDKELKALYASEPDVVLWNACYVRNLPGNFETSGVISPEGKWWDMQDFGWRMHDEPSSANDKAYWKWTMALKGLLNQYENHISVQIVVHS